MGEKENLVNKITHILIWSRISFPIRCRHFSDIFFSPSYFSFQNVCEIRYCQETKCDTDFYEESYLICENSFWFWDFGYWGYFWSLRLKKFCSAYAKQNFTLLFLLTIRTFWSNDEWQNAHSLFIFSYLSLFYIRDIVKVSPLLQWLFFLENAILRKIQQQALK